MSELDDIKRELEALRRQQSDARRRGRLVAAGAVIVGAALSVGVWTTSAAAPGDPVPNQFASGQAITAQHMNENFGELVSQTGDLEQRLAAIEDQLQSGALDVGANAVVHSYELTVSGGGSVAFTVPSGFTGVVAVHSVPAGNTGRVFLVATDGNGAFAGGYKEAPGTAPSSIDLTHVGPRQWSVVGMANDQTSVRVSLFGIEGI